MDYEKAVQDFREARRQAVREQLMARLTGKPADLLPYDEVREKLDDPILKAEYADFLEKTRLDEPRYALAW